MGTQRIVRAFGLLAALILTIPAPGLAHPLGNFSISQYSGIQIDPDAIAVRYFVDMAEVPTFQELQARDLPADRADARVGRYLRETADALKAGLVLEVDGRRLPLAVRSVEVIFPPGAADLPTMKMAILMTAPLGQSYGAVEDLRYRDENFATRTGWKEIVAVGRAGSTVVESTVPERDRSRELSDYPTDLLDAPPQAREARVRFSRVSASPAIAALTPTAPPAPSSTGRSSTATTPAPQTSTRPPETPPRETPEAPPIAAKANVQAASRGAFTDLITTREQTVSVVAIALLVAAALGAFHALEPGHGKTVVAAYLVGSRGTARHALILGLIVTASHTAGVYLLGGVTFYASQYVVPERLYPWVALASGLTIAALGLSLFWRRFRGGASEHVHHHHDGYHHHGGVGHSHRPAAAHDHDHPRDRDDVHEHDRTHDHAHGHDQQHVTDDRRAHRRHDASSVSLRQLWALGITGGIVPCPAALVVLLSALSLRRVGFGLLLIVAFSVGLALVLIAIGMLMVYARRLVARFDERGPLVTRWLPLTSSAAMTLLGVSIALQALAGGLVPWKLT